MKHIRIKFKKGLGKQLVVLGGYLLSLSQFVLLYITFLKAYFSPGKFTVVLVNTIGEADIEFILIPITLGVCVIGLIVLILNFRRWSFESEKT